MQQELAVAVGQCNNQVVGLSQLTVFVREADLVFRCRLEDELFDAILVGLGRYGIGFGISEDALFGCKDGLWHHGRVRTVGLACERQVAIFFGEHPLLGERMFQIDLSLSVVDEHGEVGAVGFRLSLPYFRGGAAIERLRAGVGVVDSAFRLLHDLCRCYVGCKERSNGEKRSFFHLVVFFNLLIK